LFKRPESVLVVIHTAWGQVLQLRRREPPDYWQSVTGSLDPGETPLHAAQREVREETGLVADLGLADSGVINRYPIHPAWRHKFAPGVAENSEYVFSLRLPDRVPVALDRDEHLEFRWLPRDDAAVLASSATDRAAILALVPVISPQA
jgi:dihydroneopterin triphosphate diphosphatase